MERKRIMVSLTDEEYKHLGLKPKKEKPNTNNVANRSSRKPWRKPPNERLFFLPVTP